MTEIDILRLAYFAGLFDGEGCISISKINQKGYSRPGFQLRCSVSITDHQCAKELHEAFGGGLIELGGKTKKRRKYWQWAVTSSLAYSFLIKLSPFLQIKSRQAEIGIAFQGRREQTAVSRKTDSEWNLENEQYELIRILNARYNTEYWEEHERQFANVLP